MMLTRKISEHFTLAETQCKCGVKECVKSTADVELVWLLEVVRAHFGGKPVIVHSWFRCRAHNNRPTTEVSSAGVRGAGSGDYSWHPLGGACDFHIATVAPERIANFVRETFPSRFGVGLYDWGVHLDVRLTSGDWDERKEEPFPITYA